MSMRNPDSGDYLTADQGDPGGNDLMRAEGAADSFSVIDRYSTFDGTFHSSRDLRIEGEAKGTIECQGTLMVAQGANVSAKVEAENVTVAGDLNGDVRCRGRLQIMPSGKVRGKVVTDSLVINEGAFYEGQLEMTAMANLANPTLKGPRPIAPISSAPGNGERSSARPATDAGAPANSSTFIRRFGGPEQPWVEEDEPEKEGES
jgi:cytoskeletal protein CcmA (bactofilin family)